MPKAAVVLLLLLLLRTVKSQLQVQIRRYSQITLNDSDFGDNFTLQAEYIFPSGFSDDWFITSHVNIPAEGITGLLCRPQSKDESQPLNSSQCYSEDGEFTRVAIIDSNHDLCTEQITHFDALITYSPGDKDRDVSNYQITDTPFAIVSEEFYFMLQDSIEDCSDEIDTLINLSVGGVDVPSVHIALLMFILLCGMLCMCTLIILLFLTALCCGKCLKKRGSYDVHENQLHELGPAEELRGGTFRGTLTLPYTPEERHFHSGDSNTQCAICLEDFVDGELTSILACNASHVFHPICINKWLESQSTCPVCRTMMTNTWL